jgi:O-antigen/teichoic acid export membrane protein
MFGELKRLLKQSAIYGIGSIVSPFIGFIMLPLYSRFLAPTEYGILAITSVVINFLTALVSLGINSGLIRFYFAYSEKKDKDEVVVSSILFSFLASVTIVGVLWVFSTPISNFIFDFDRGLVYLKLILLLAVVDTGITNCLAVLRAEERPAIYSVMTVLKLVLTLSLIIVFVAVLKRKVQGILEAELLGAAIVYSVGLVIAMKGKAPSFSWAKLKQVLSFGVPLVPGNLASLVVTLSDRYFLKHFATMQDVGLYSVGYRVSAALRIALIEPFRMAWPPYMFSVVEKPEAKDIYKSVLVYFTFVTVWGGLCLSVFAKEALIILATPPYYGAYKVVPLLILSQILLGMCAILVAGIQISNKTKYASYSFMIAAGVSLGMNFLLVPRLGMMGAALASVTAYTVLNLFYFTFSQKFYYIRHEFRRTALIVVTGIGVYGIASAVTGKMGLAPSVVVKLVAVVMFPVVLYALGFFRQDELRKIKEIIKRLLRLHERRS